MLISTSQGKISVSTDVIATIAGVAATSCFGVRGMVVKNVADGIVRLLKRDHMTKGVSVTECEDGSSVNIELHISVKHGININAACNSIMSEVKYNVERLAGVKVSNIDIFIESIKSDSCKI